MVRRRVMLSPIARPEKRFKVGLAAAPALAENRAALNSITTYQPPSAPTCYITRQASSVSIASLATHIAGVMCRRIRRR